MGKFQSKHGCFLVSADLNKTLEDKIWKKKTGFNLANYNMDEALSELSICLEERIESTPLRVHLPPEKLETDTTKLLRLDRVGLGSQESKDGAEKSKIKIEEFECGVQFESSDSAKQEWSFTLYDFDGHGRITKEDLASLLKALYDAVGSSIRLPPNGAKTLKLRLSVGQDCAPQIQNVASPKSKNTNKVTKTKLREFSKLNNLSPTQLKCTNENQGQSSVLTSQNQPEVRTQCQSSQRGACRHTVTDPHHQLVDPAQDDIEQSHVRQSRKHRSDCRNDHKQHHHKRQHRTSGTQCPVTSVSAAQSAMATAPAAGDGWGENAGLSQAAGDERPKESQDRRNYYLDLVGIENNSSKFQNNTTVLPAGAQCPQAGSGICASGPHEAVKSSNRDSVHAGDRCEFVSASLQEKCDNVQRDSERQGARLLHHRPEHQHFQSKSLNAPEPSGHAQSPKTQGGAVNSDSLPGRFSLPGHASLTEPPPPASCHRRHRQREKHRDLAMQQVAEWIEREHAWDVDGGHVIIQRHEHHHVHEHHHHHHFHHHYQA